MTAPDRQQDARAELWRRIHASHPAFREAVAADALIALWHRGEPAAFRSRLHAVGQIVRLAWVSDAFLAQAVYRAKARLQALGVPILPALAHRLAIALAQVSIGDPVIMAPGVYIAHGQVVIDGLVEIGKGVVIGPFVSIGLRAGNIVGPTIEDEAQIGTGARVLGPLRIGRQARVGANAVVIGDVPAGATVVGAPARPL